jgi:hypothetical protein
VGTGEHPKTPSNKPQKAAMSCLDVQDYAASQVQTQQTTVLAGQDYNVLHRARLLLTPSDAAFTSIHPERG